MFQDMIAAGSGGGGWNLEIKSPTLTKNQNVTIETGLPSDFIIEIGYARSGSQMTNIFLHVENNVVVFSATDSNFTVTFDSSTMSVSVNQNLTSNVNDFAEYLFTK